MSKECMYQKIVDEIKGQIQTGKIRPGDKIPTVEAIRAKYGVSHITGLRALKELALENFVELEKGKGYFAKDKREHRKPSVREGTIACLVRPLRATTPYDNYFNEINQGIQNECMRNFLHVLYPFCCQGLTENYSCLDVQRLLGDKIIELANHVDGFIIDERVDDKVISESLNKMDKPMVLVNRTSRADVDTVSPDNVAGTKKAVDLCLKMRYDFFIACRNVNAVENNGPRTDAFIETLREQGISDKNLVEVDICAGPFEESLSAIESQPIDKRKALVFSPVDDFSRWLVDELVAKGVDVGNQIGVIGFGGTGHATLRAPHVATIDARPATLGREAVKVLLTRVNATNFDVKRNHVIPSVIQLGETL